MTIRQKLEAIRANAASVLPGLITAVNASLDQFDDYLAKPPTDEDKKQFAVYLDQTKNDEPLKEFNIICQLQLPGILSDDGNDYQQAAEDYFSAIDPNLIDMESRGEILGDAFPIDEINSTIIMLTVRFQKSTDDCNYDDSR